MLCALRVGEMCIVLCRSLARTVRIGVGFAVSVVCVEYSLPRHGVEAQRRGRCSLCSKGPAPIKCRMFWYSYTNFEGVKVNFPVIYF